MASKLAPFQPGRKAQLETEENIALVIRLCALYVVSLGDQAASELWADVSTTAGLLLAFIALVVTTGPLHSLRSSATVISGGLIAASLLLLTSSLRQIGFSRVLLSHVIGTTLLPSVLGCISRRSHASIFAIFASFLGWYFLSTSAACRDPPCEGTSYHTFAAVTSGALSSLQLMMAGRINASLAGRHKVKMEQCAAVAVAAGLSLLWTICCWLVQGRGMLHHQAAAHWWASSGVGFLLQASGLLGLALVQSQGSGGAFVQSPAASMRAGSASVAVAVFVEAALGEAHSRGRLGSLLLAALATEAACWARWRGRMRSERLLPGGLSSIRGAAAHVKSQALHDLFDSLERLKSTKGGKSSVFVDFCRSIMKGADSMAGGGKQTRLMTFLSINTALMFVEFGYGALNNNLGLLSDGCHMLFDNASLAIGLYAAHMATLPADSTFTFGYGRVESLAGFANGILLIFVALEILLESVERLMEPPSLSTDGLLLVSILGLVVNVIGLVCCHEAHDHHHHHHSHGDGGEGDGSGSSSDDDEECHEIHDHNMRAVFLHILADTLGSVSVIISVLCIQYLGWNWADPIASFFISICTMASVMPLIQQTAEVLLLRVPRSKARALSVCQAQVEALPGVEGLLGSRFWCHTPDVACGVVQVGVRPGSDGQAILSQTRRLYSRAKLAHFTVEVSEVVGHSGLLAAVTSVGED